MCRRQAILRPLGRGGPNKSYLRGLALGAIGLVLLAAYAFTVVRWLSTTASKDNSLRAALRRLFRLGPQAAADKLL